MRDNERVEAIGLGRTTFHRATGGRQLASLIPLHSNLRLLTLHNTSTTQIFIAFDTATGANDDFRLTPGNTLSLRITQQTANRIFVNVGLLATGILNVVQEGSD